MGTAASAHNTAVDTYQLGQPRAVAEVTEGFIKSDSISHWTANKVGVWLLNTCELGQYVESFYTSRVNGAVLKDLGEDDLKILGVNDLMHRKRIFAEICKQNEFELDEMESAVSAGTTPRHWASSSPRFAANKAALNRLKSLPLDSPKFTLGPNGTPRAWDPNGSNDQLNGVRATTPKHSPFKTVASINLMEALDEEDAILQRRRAKWYANKVVEKSLIAMRAALKTPRGMAVLQAEARYANLRRNICSSF